MWHLRSWLKRFRNTFKQRSRCRRTYARNSIPSRRPAFDLLEDRTLPAVIGNGTGLLAQYYSDSTFTHLQATRIDPTVNFNWNGAAPAAGVPATHFSVRWTGQIEATVTGSQSIYIHADDGVRLIVNGKTVIDAMVNSVDRELRTLVNFTAGQKYTIELDYSENTDPAAMQLFWAGPNILPWAVIPKSQLFPASTPPAAAPAPPAPTASLSAPNVTTAGATTYSFNVTYTDSLALNTATLDGKDVVVTGPKGFSQAASFTGFTAKGNTWTATYRITAPGGTWDSTDNGTYAITLQANQVGDASRSVAGGSLGTFNVALLGSSDWFSQHLTDPGIQSLTRSLDADGSISRNDMIAIFREAETNGITAAEMTDLKTLVANASFLKMTDAVQNLAGKVVNGDPANQQYQGQALGNLAVGSSGQQLEKLVDKWFLGMDHPTIAIDPALGPNFYPITYVLASGTLFGTGGPTFSNVLQGDLNDCYFDAALSEVALRSPQSITSMFTDNGDGTYTVRFLNGSVADYVTVDRYLPAYTSSSGAKLFLYDDMATAVSSATNVLWAPLLEKAYAQLAASGWSRGSGLPNAYHSIETGWEGSIIQQITGKSVTADLVTNSPAGLSAIVNAFQSGKMVAIDSDVTGPQIDTGSAKPIPAARPLIPDHVYVVVGYNAATQTFDLWNVWGYHQSVTWTQIAANFDTWSQSA